MKRNILWLVIGLVVILIGNQLLLDAHQLGQWARWVGLILNCGIVGWLAEQIEEPKNGR